jgi:hypothetical protein
MVCLQELVLNNVPSIGQWLQVDVVPPAPAVQQPALLTEASLRTEAVPPPVHAAPPLEQKMQSMALDGGATAPAAPLLQQRLQSAVYDESEKDAAAPPVHAAPLVEQRMQSMVYGSSRDAAANSSLQAVQPVAYPQAVQAPPAGGVSSSYPLYSTGGGYAAAGYAPQHSQLQEAPPAAAPYGSYPPAYAGYPQTQATPFGALPYPTYGAPPAGYPVYGGPPPLDYATPLSYDAPPPDTEPSGGYPSGIDYPQPAGYPPQQYPPPYPPPDAGG